MAGAGRSIIAVGAEAAGIVIGIAERILGAIAIIGGRCRVEISGQDTQSVWKSDFIRIKSVSNHRAIGLRERERMCERLLYIKMIYN